MSDLVGTQVVGFLMHSLIYQFAGALYILYPGLYILGAVLFIPAMFIMKKDAEKIQGDSYVRMVDHVPRKDSD